MKGSWSSVWMCYNTHREDAAMEARQKHRGGNCHELCRRNGVAFFEVLGGKRPVEHPLCKVAGVW